MVVEKKFDVVSFKQSEVLEKSIKTRTQRKSKSKNEFEKDVYKLRNFVFRCKTMRNNRKI